MFHNHISNVTQYSNSEDEATYYMARGIIFTSISVSHHIVWPWLFRRKIDKFNKESAIRKADTMELNSDGTLQVAKKVKGRGRLDWGISVGCLGLIQVLSDFTFSMATNAWLQPVQITVALYLTCIASDDSYLLTTVCCVCLVELSFSCRSFLF